MQKTPDIIEQINQGKVMMENGTMIADRLNHLLQNELCSTDEIANLIGQDQILTARVLKLINSAFYGFPHRISTISQAIVLLGFDALKGLILSASVIDQMNDSISGLFEHSIGCSIACSMIAKSAKQPDPEELQIAGLLHDFGKVVLALEYPEQYARVQQTINKENISFYQAEQKVLNGISHCEIADALFQFWKIPDRLRITIRYHHKPHRAGRYSENAAVIQIGDMLVRSIGFGHGGDSQVNQIDPEWLDLFDLNESNLEVMKSDLSEALEKINFNEFK